MSYCFTDDWGCPYYVPETGACLLEDPALECDDYAAFIEDEYEIMDMIDMHALNPQPSLQGAKVPRAKVTKL